MELFVGLLTVAATIGIPVLLHRASHPKRELRYAVTLANASTGTWRVVIWSAARADIPSSLYDGDRPIIFRFSVPVVSGSVTSSLLDGPLWVSETELHLGPRLLHTDFQASAEFSTSRAFDVKVDKTLIDVSIVEDRAVANTPQPRQIAAVERSQARARLTLRTVWSYVLIGSFVLFVVGLSLSLGGIEPLGTSLGGASLVLFPVGLVLLLIDGIRRITRRA